MATKTLLTVEEYAAFEEPEGGKLEPEVRSAKRGDKFEEPELLPGFSLPLAEILQ
jgi:Uma2 family endonuclease